MTRRLLALVVGAVVPVLSACGGSEIAGGRTVMAEPRDPLAMRLAGASDQLSDADSESLATGKPYSSSFAGAMHRIMRDLNDEDVSLETWIRQSKVRLKAMYRSLTVLQGRNATLEDREVAGVLDGLHKRQLRIADAMSELRAQIVNGGSEHEISKAGRAVDRAAERAREHANKLLRDMGPYLDSDDVVEGLRERYDEWYGSAP